MKINKLLFIVMALFVTQTISAQKKTSFIVDGECGMCKNRIENKALEFNYVDEANWNKDTKILSLKLKSSHSTDEIQRAIASIGHDTEKYKSEENIYESLPGCCHYREGDVDDDHSDHTHGQIWEIDINGKKVPLEGVSVVWKETNKGVVTGKQGTFVLPHNHDSERVIISFVGYGTKDVFVGDKDFIEVVFSDNNLLDEVVVSYRKKPTTISFLSTLKVQEIGSEELQKAACCNLSESFETNPAVDVSSTDAVTGTRQIEMLGLAGSYVQITRENIPETRGLSAIYGLTYTPGPWIESIQLNMGSGSVVNGFESITGQINTELQKPNSGDKLSLNAYVNGMGRIEGNAVGRVEINEHLSTSVLLHANTKKIKWDNNEDGFLDTPIGDQLIALNRWEFSGHDGWHGQFGIKGLYLNQNGGQTDYYKYSDSSGFWNSKINTNRIDSWVKVGKVINDKSSFGLQLSGVLHDQKSSFGNRSYDATQQSFYSNFIYQYTVTDKSEIKTGISFIHDNLDEYVETTTYLREENVVGVFGEYTYKANEKFTSVLGLRVDSHNNYGVFLTPRLHLKYAISDKSVFRVSVGRGQKTASIFSENIGAMASSRKFNIISENNNNPYGLNPEVAWSYGASYSKGFTVNGKDIIFNADYFFTDFENKIVVDFDNNPKELIFYNLNGRSYSHSFQLQVDWEIFERLNTRVAYRFNDVKTDYISGLNSKPLLASHKAFINLSYATNNDWKFDVTTSWQGEKRIPNTTSSPAQFRLDEISPSFFVTNFQISKSWYDDKFEVYSGVENLFDYKQDNPIVSADDPFGEYFDASMIWGPVFGRNIYAGARYRF